MKMNLVVASLLLVGTARTVSIEMPDWVNQVDTILTGVQGMRDMFVRDMVLYQDFNGTLEAMFNDFDRRDLERKKLFDVIRCKVNKLTSQLALVESTNASQIAEKEERIRDLESDILAIRHETQLEIDRLNDVINKLNIELNSMREAYATLINMNGEKAEALISQLSSVKQAYSSMVDSRGTFLATLDRFINRTRAHLAKSSADTKELGIEIIGAGFIESCNPTASDNS